MITHQSYSWQGSTEISPSRESPHDRRIGELAEQQVLYST